MTINKLTKITPILFTATIAYISYIYTSISIRVVDTLINHPLLLKLVSYTAIIVTTPIVYVSAISRIPYPSYKALKAVTDNLYIN